MVTQSACGGIPRTVTEKMTDRLNIPVPPELVRAIDEWRRFQPDIPPRATAARRLIEAGLHALQTKDRAAPARKEPAKRGGG